MKQSKNGKFISNYEKYKPRGLFLEFYGMFQNDVAYHVDLPTLTMCADDYQLYAAG